MLWGPKATPSFSDLLGLTELRNTVILTITVYNHERIQIKIEWNLEKARHQHPGVSPLGVIRTELNSSTNDV